MPDRIYVLLYALRGNDTTDLFFPVKANGQPKYPNMPQFFGGRQENGEDDKRTMARELWEESAEQLTLGDTNPMSIHKYTDAQGNSLRFYVAPDWESVDGKDFVGALPEGEMQSIEKFSVKKGNHFTVTDMMNRLGLTPPTADFKLSQTWVALANTLEWAQESDTFGRHTG